MRQMPARGRPATAEAGLMLNAGYLIIRL